MFPTMRLFLACAVGLALFTLGWSGSAGAQTSCTIKTVSDLQNIQNNLSGNYCLANNMVGGSIVPIGTSTTPFTGTFDGRGYEIGGVTISGTGIYVGLFAYLGDGGKISNVRLTNLTVMAPFGYDVGGLVGRNRGTITDCYTTGSVSGTAGNNVAGLNGVAVGGLVGWNFGTITQSYSSASVTSPTTADVELGGLAGGNSGMISWSHATGLISGNGSGGVEIGGLVGQLGDNINPETGTIANSYATGTVKSTGSNTYAGGLVGLPFVKNIRGRFLEPEVCRACDIATRRAERCEYIDLSMSAVLNP
jgi:hypothetical protein